jgi:hypothetical protein
MIVPLIVLKRNKSRQARMQALERAAPGGAGGGPGDQSESIMSSTTLLATFKTATLFFYVLLIAGSNSEISVTPVRPVVPKHLPR